MKLALLLHDNSPVCSLIYQDMGPQNMQFCERHDKYVQNVMAQICGECLAEETNSKVSF